MKNIIKVLIVGSLVAATGCKKDADLSINRANCDAKVSGYWANGNAQAIIDNNADTAQGTADGNALGYTDGLTAGQAQAYTNGYNSVNGYPKGYNEQYPIGYAFGSTQMNAANNGHNAGVQNGVTTGAADGQSHGNADGSADGKDDAHYDATPIGTADGYNDGYDDGYYAGQTAAYNDPVGVCGGGRNGARKVKDPTPAELDMMKNQCYAKGYNEKRNTTAYQTAYNAAVASNQAYHQGYQAGLADAASFNLGVSTGYTNGKAKGYADGKDNGYTDVYNANYGPAYTANYNAVYTTAYNNAYNSAYASSYSAWYITYYNDAYDYHYNFGYDDGFVDGEDDWCYLYGRAGGDGAKIIGEYRVNGQLIAIGQMRLPAPYTPGMHSIDGAKAVGRPSYRKSANYKSHSAGKVANLRNVAPAQTPARADGKPTTKKVRNAPDMTATRLTHAKQNFNDKAMERKLNWLVIPTTSPYRHK